jgi:hypothetical protein
MVFIGETTARPAQHGNFDFLESGDDIVANSARVGNWAVFTDPNAFVNATAEMLGELAVDVAIDSSAGLFCVNDQFSCSRNWRIRGQDKSGSEREEERNQHRRSHANTPKENQRLRKA